MNATNRVPVGINFCDHGHHTDDETRLLPIGGGGNVIVCFTHWEYELRFRRERIAAGVPFDLPEWKSLAIYGTEAVQQPARRIGAGELAAYERVPSVRVQLHCLWRAVSQRRTDTLREPER